jgi:signal peptidase I
MTASRSKKEAEIASISRANPKRQEGMRETIEAVAIAFILAFVFKTFQAEAFVIPTGSMAPTLYGRHKEVTCSGCRIPYTIGASQEVYQDSGVINPEGRVLGSVCPNCRFENDVEHAAVFNGDRIVVNKQVSEFKRFDVVVFKNPEEPYVNYIKRLIGLPSETVQFRQGDVYAKAEGEPDFTIRRKADPATQQDIQLLVYDDEYPPHALLTGGAEERWVPSVYTPSDNTMGGWPVREGGWKPDPDARTYSLSASAEELLWLRYRHLVPEAALWRATETEQPAPAVALSPMLVTDFCGFNSVEFRSPRMNNDPLDDGDLYWVNDLTLNAKLDIRNSSLEAVLILELIEGVRAVQTRFHPASGKVEILRRDRNADGVYSEGTVVATAESGASGDGEYEFSFANVDDRVLLWINGSVVVFDKEVTFVTEGFNLPGEQDLAPAGIAAKGMDVTASALNIRRDIYYRADVLEYSDEMGRSGNPAYGASRACEIADRDFRTLAANLRSPQSYGSEYVRLVTDQRSHYGNLFDLQLDADEYLMCGDNSPASKDSRLFDYWSRPLRGIQSHRYAVRETDLIGRAMFIFWPHGIPFMNGGNGFPVKGHATAESDYRHMGKEMRESDADYPLYRAPFYPNISRMKKIR